jgi:putative exporter of polyketide antibiotics
MSVSVQIGLLLALATAFASVLGFLYEHRGAVESPQVEMRRPVRTSLALFRSRWYVLGILIALAGLGPAVGALAVGELPSHRCQIDESIPSTAPPSGPAPRAAHTAD